MLPREQSNFQSIKDFARITAQKKLDGILCTAWDDCSPHFETYWRGFHDFAFFSWNYKDVKVDDVHAMFRQRYYGPALKDEIFEIQTQLEQSLPFWDTALLDKGHRQNYPGNIDLIELPDPGRIHEWTGVYGSRVEEANNATSRYDLIKERITQALQLARRNDYTLRILNGINELHVYPAMILVLLGKFDKAETPTTKKAAAKELEILVNSFSTLRKKYEDVFSKTRILSNSPNYITDQNHHHHLANGSNNSDWMYVYELAMNKKISRWLAGMRY